MVTQPYEAAATVLADARREHRVLSQLPDALVPADVAEGYAVQDAFRRLWPDTIVGWKAGATAAPVQKRFGVNEPFAGPFYAADTFQAPARIEARRFAHLCLESEFAFRFGRTLAARSEPYTRDEVLAAVDALVPAIEIVGPRFDSLALSGPVAIADCALDAGFVLGEPVTDWRGYDLPAHKVTLTVDGKVRAQGTGANVLGDPIAALLWTVRHLGSRAIAIRAGQILSTGTTTGLEYILPEETAVADFGPLGTVEVRFTGPAHPRAVRPA
jgi:2-keto-4-pentenoate hydratase